MDTAGVTGGEDPSKTPLASMCCVARQWSGHESQGCRGGCRDLGVSTVDRDSHATSDRWLHGVGMRSRARPQH